MNKRKHIRFPADEGDFATLHRSDKPDVPGLIINESLGGCALVFFGSEVIGEGETCRLTVGKLAPLNAKAMWIKQVDNEVCKIGFEFEE